MNLSSRAFLLVLVLTSIFVTRPVVLKGEGLPEEGCIRLLREARIARLEGQPEREIRLLRKAAEDYPDELAPIQELLARRGDLPPDEFESLLDLYINRLEHWKGLFPIPVLKQMVALPETDADALSALGQHLRQRIGELESQTDLELLVLQAQIEERLHNDEARLEVLERVWAVERREEIVWSLVILYEKLELWQQGSTFLGELVARGSTGFRFAYIQALARAGRYEDLLRETEALTKLAPEDRPSDRVLVDLLKAAAWDLYDLERDAEAEDLFRRALALDPAQEELQKILLHLYSSEEEQRQHAVAIETHWQGESDPRTLFDEGTHRLTAGNNASAYELLSRAAPGLPDLEAAWYNLGLAAYKIEKWPEAAEAYRRASELNPGRGDSYYFRGLALQQIDRCEEAVPALEKALELDPGRSQGFYYLSHCYAALGEREKARSAMEKYRNP